MAGSSSLEHLFEGADGGIFIGEVDHGSLDPLLGDCTIGAAHGRRIVGGKLADYIGPLSVHGVVADLLSAVQAVGRDPELGGAGWCAKGGQKLPVWATTPAILLDRATIAPEWMG